MQTESNPLAERFIARNLLDLAIRITLIGGLTVWCYRVAEPFIGMLLWSIILAVTLAPLHMRLTRLLGARPRLAAVVLTLATMLVLLVPGAMLTASLGDSLVNIFHHSTGRIVRIPAPPDFVIELPLIGVRLHEIWLQAMTNLQDVLKPLQPHLATAGRWLLAGMASAGLASPSSWPRSPSRASSWSMPTRPSAPRTRSACASPGPNRASRWRS